MHDVLLRNEAHHRAIALERIGQADTPAIDLDDPVYPCVVDLSGERVEERALPCAGAAEDRRQSPGFDLSGDVVNDGLPRFKGDAHVLERDPNGEGLWLYSQLRVSVVDCVRFLGAAHTVCLDQQIYTHMCQELVVLHTVIASAPLRPPLDSAAAKVPVAVRFEVVE